MAYFTKTIHDRFDGPPKKITDKELFAELSKRVVTFNEALEIMTDLDLHPNKEVRFGTQVFWNVKDNKTEE